MTALSTQEGWFKRQLALVTTPPIPRRVRRLIFISSILGLIKEAKDPDQYLVEKLNKILQVGYNNAWALPMQVKSLIWKHLDSNIIEINGRSIALSDLRKVELDEKDQAVVGDWFVKRAPKWLKYGSEDLMRFDIATLIGQLQQLKAA